MGTLLEDLGLRELSEEDKAKANENIRMTNEMLRHRESPKEREERLEREKEKKRGHLFQWLTLAVALLSILVAIALSKGWI